MNIKWRMAIACLTLSLTWIANEAPRPAHAADSATPLVVKKVVDGNGDVVRLELDRNHDGRVDEVTEKLDHGEVRIRRDRSFSGHFDETTTQSFDGSRLVTETIERPDERITRTYEPSGRFVLERTETGRKPDGTFKTFSFRKRSLISAR